MKPISTLILTLISIIGATGQDYQTVSSGRIAYFDNSFKNIKSIRIDSVRFQTDSVLYPFAVISPLGDYCFSPKVASWIGKSVVIKENGENLFFNKEGDTITIITGARPGEKWTAGRSADSLIIEASVTHHDTMSFLGLVDSVKTIGFQAYDKTMNPLTREINTMKIIISQHYGFVKTFNFYLFPDFHVDYPTEEFQEYFLIGLSNPKTGVQNLTWFDVNDFQVGDEIHILDESSCWNGNGDGSATTIKSNYKYLERTDYMDSIVYRYSRKESIYTAWTDGNSFKFYNDTLISVIKPDSLFDRLPGEPIVTDYEAYNYYMTNESPLSKTNSRGYESFIFSGDSCWFIPIADGCLTNDKYVEKLGGPYYSCTHAFCLGGSERKLVYYKKGETTWGSPLLVTEISEMEAEKNIEVYPNPTHDYITINFRDKMQSDCTIHIFDIQGRLVHSGKLGTNSSEIDISAYKSGIYILKIADNDKVLKMDKLIIE